jgi:hypothetical protein
MVMLRLINRPKRGEFVNAATGAFITGAARISSLPKVVN